MTHRHILKQDSEGEEKEMCVLSGSIQHAGKKKFRQRKVNKNAFPISLFLPRVASLEKLFCFFFFFFFVPRQKVLLNHCVPEKMEEKQGLENGSNNPFGR